MTRRALAFTGGLALVAAAALVVVGNALGRRARLRMYGR